MLVYWVQRKNKKNQALMLIAGYNTMREANKITTKEAKNIVQENLHCKEY